MESKEVRASEERPFVYRDICKVRVEFATWNGMDYYQRHVWIKQDGTEDTEGWIPTCRSFSDKVRNNA